MSIDAGIFCNIRLKNEANYLEFFSKSLVSGKNSKVYVTNFI